MENIIRITAESEKEAVRKFGVWKREMETWELKVNIKKTKLMVMMGREPAVRLQRGRNFIWCLWQMSWSKLNMVSRL